MPIKRMYHITREFVQKNPSTLFVFGDNMLHRGYGGQAKEMRGEPNTVGIPTKWAPNNKPEAFFTNDDFPHVKDAICDALTKISKHLSNGGTVVFPEKGVGTGLADLPNKAPAIHQLITYAIEDLEELEKGFIVLRDCPKL